MGWFDDQIRERIKNDDEMFSDAIAGMASIVMGEKIGRMLNEDTVITRNAIEEILKYYHIKSREVEVQTKDLDGQLEYLMRPAGVMRRTVLLEEEWYKDGIGAMLAIRKDENTVIALIPDKFYGYSFYDVKSNKRVKVTKYNKDLIDEEAMLFYKPLPLGKLSVKELVLYIWNCHTFYDKLVVNIMAFLITAIGLLLPQLNNVIYRYVIPESKYMLFFAVFSFLFSIKISTLLLRTAKSLACDRLARKTGLQVQAATMMRVLSLPANFFKDYSAGDLASRMGYISSISTHIVNFIFSVGLSSLISFVYIAQMIKYGPGLVIPGLLVFLFTCVVTIVSGLMQINISRKTIEIQTKEQGMNYALVSGVQKIKLSGSEKRAFSRWAKLYQKSLKYKYDPPILVKFAGLISTTISLIGTIVLYFYTIKTNVALADYFAFNAAFGMVMGSFGGILQAIHSLALVKPMFDMVKPILEAEPEITTKKKIVTRLSGSIEVNNVSFRYSKDMPNVLDNFSLKIKRGEYVAIVGATGCGKSTLLRILMGFEKPQKGSTYYDGKDINTLDLKSLRQHIGTVLQDGKLFQGDIFSNITITAPNLTMDDAWEAARLSGIDEDIKEMPMGMHTVISEGAGGISGGQKQRLLIARAVAPKPKILMFDEATSALDNITQKKVSDALAELKCTRIVIAHRLSTITACDRIVVMDKGKIIEEGKYDELIAKKGFFAELIDRQRIDNTKSIEI